MVSEANSKPVLHRPNPRPTKIREAFPQKAGPSLHPAPAKLRRERKSAVSVRDDTWFPVPTNPEVLADAMSRLKRIVAAAHLDCYPLYFGHFLYRPATAFATAA